MAPTPGWRAAGDRGVRTCRIPRTPEAGSSERLRSARLPKCGCRGLIPQTVSDCFQANRRMRIRTTTGRDAPDASGSPTLGKGPQA